MDADERERSLIIPLIYTFFCLCVAVGGLLLVFYVFFPDLSRPWQPIAALALICSTWLFWLLAYIYSCLKHCLLRPDDPRPVAARNASMSVSATPQRRSTCSRKVEFENDSSVIVTRKSKIGSSYPRQDITTV